MRNPLQKSSTYNKSKLQHIQEQIWFSWSSKWPLQKRILTSLIKNKSKGKKINILEWQEESSFHLHRWYSHLPWIAHHQQGDTRTLSHGKYPGWNKFFEWKLENFNGKWKGCWALIFWVYTLQAVTLALLSCQQPPLLSKHSFVSTSVMIIRPKYGLWEKAKVYL